MPIPSGTVTFLFTDIEGSTKLWEQYQEAMRAALARHDALLRQAIEENAGVVFKTIGDAFCAAFATAPDALRAALVAQQALHAEVWPEPLTLKVRMALHTGAVEARDGDYFGQPLNRVARLLSAGHGGQTLLSDVASDLCADTLPAGVTLHSLGAHTLRDLGRRESVFQLQHPALPADFPPLKTLDSLPNNLPQQLTSFIGREKEIAESKSLLAKTRLLTLTGSGGSGKTRLALQAGAETLEEYKDGVWLVELAALSDPDTVPRAVATVLGVREEAGRPLRQTLEHSLRDRQLLLILDNCEHLIEVCAHLADSLLKTCPHLTILATSREPLNVAGERSWRVPSLLIPGPGDLPAEEKDIAAVLLEYDACRLFVERAVAQRQEFVVTRANAPVVAHLCRQLDGIPLALELAAARVRSLSVEEINARLDNRFHLLTGGSRAALPRQQTLRATIDWSYNLLNAQEKMLLRRVSVFAGGWTLPAAEQVGAGESAGGETIAAWDVVELLTSLADKSLVLAQSQGDTTRYRLLETVRQYAWNLLVESQESPEVRVCHGDYFLQFAEEIKPKLLGAEQVHWMQVLEEEHDNLRQALALYTEDAEGSEKGMRLGAALQMFWGVRGYMGEGRERLSLLLAHPGGQKPTSARAGALHSMGALAYFQGDYAPARPLYEESLAIRRELGDNNGITRTLNNLAVVVEAQGDYAQARALHEESLAIAREMGDMKGIAASLNNLATVAHRQSDCAQARPLYEESLTLQRELGNKTQIAGCLNNLGDVARIQGDYARSHVLFEESLTIAREVGDKRNITDTLLNLGTLAHAQGDYARSHVLFEESLATAREVGDRRSIADVLGNLGTLAYAQEDYAQARALHEESLATARELGTKAGIANSLETLGEVARMQSDYAQARALHKESLTLRRELGDTKGVADSLKAFASLAANEALTQRSVCLWGAVAVLQETSTVFLPQLERERQEREIAVVREAMDETAFAAAWAQGRVMTMEQAVERAMEDGDA